MKNKCGIIIIIILTASVVRGDYRWPIKGKPMITASFLEYRGNWGHNGLDMCTHWRAGEPVLSANNGWVSSIMYQHWGIGFAVFVDHADGYRTFYGHMKGFASRILHHEETKKIQDKILNRKDFRIYFKKDAIQVKSGDVVGYSGDTGRGPIHLHFEVRKAETDSPVNPLVYAYKINDSSAPVILKAFLVPLDGYSHVDDFPESGEYAVRHMGGGIYTLNTNTLPVVAGRIGIKVMAYDKIGFTSTVGIYGAKIFINNKEAYGFQFDSIDRKKTHRMGLFYDRLKSTLSRYTYYLFSRVTMRGIIRTHEPGEITTVKVVCYDVNRNRAELHFKVKAGKPLDEPEYVYKPNLIPGIKLQLTSLDEKFNITFGKKAALYQDMVAVSTENGFKSGVKGLTVKSKVYAVTPTDLALDNPALVKLEYRGKDYKKVGIYGMSDSGSYYFLDNTYNKRKKLFTTSSWNVMRYFLIRDDIPPRIRFYSHNRRVTKRRGLKLYVSDIGTGVHLGKVKLKIDGKDVHWAYEIDRYYIEVLPHNPVWDKGKHTILMQIRDVAGNKSPLMKYYYYVR